MVLGAVALGLGNTQDLDSLFSRLDQARSLSEKTSRQLDSLRGELMRVPVRASGPGDAPALSAEDSAIWREVRAEKRRRVELEKAFDFRRASLGYTFNPNLVLGMNAIGWVGDWGVKLDGRFNMIESRRAVGANASLLYAVHEFYLTGEEMFTRLYLFTGSGYYWERSRASTHVWYEVPDRVWRVQMGAGTELGLRDMNGTRFTPEIGFQGSRFLTRFQESELYTGDRPRSHFSLYPYYAIHINFYFL